MPEYIDFANPPMLAPGVGGYSVDEGERGLYIPTIDALQEGSGAVGAYLDSLPRNRRVVFPTVISARLRGMLERRGFVPGVEYDAEVGEFEMMVRDATE